MLRLAALALLALAGCAGPLDAPPSPAAETEPLWPVVRLAAGQADTLALPGLGPDASFGEHPNARATALDDGRVAVRTADGFSGLAQIPVGDAGHVLVAESTVWPAVTLRFEPPLRPLQVAYAPETMVLFEDPALPRVRLTDPERDGVLETALALPPGRHPYLLSVDGVRGLDPANPDSARSADGIVRSVLTVEPVPPGRLVLTLVGMDPETPDLLLLSLTRFDADGHEVPTEVEEEEGIIALLGNHPFQDNAVDAYENAVRLDLDAAGPDRQRLRLAARVDGIVSNWVALDLVDGRPVPN